MVFDHFMRGKSEHWKLHGKLAKWCSIYTQVKSSTDPQNAQFYLQASSYMGETDPLDINWSMRACAIRRLAWIDLIPALGQMGNVGHEWCTMLRNATWWAYRLCCYMMLYNVIYIYIYMLFATQLQATLELKLSPHLWSLLVRKTCDILRSAPCIPDSVNSDQFKIFLPPSKFSNRKGTNCAFLRSQLPWLVHGSVPQLCFTQLMTTERLCLGHGHIDISIISDSIDPHGNQAPSNTTGWSKMLPAVCFWVWRGYWVQMIWMVCVELCWFGMCRWNH